MWDKDCYHLLNINPNATETTIRKAYRSRSRDLHPDVNASPNAAEEFSELASALEILLDPIKRLKHDHRFGYTKKARNQDENAKQRFSEEQQERASKTVQEISESLINAKTT